MHCTGSLWIVVFLVSAFRDDRFRPVMLEEVPHLECEVSLLHSFEKARNPLDWEVGKHGIMIDFEVEDQSFSATFLPEVASEEGWDQLTTLKYLVAKAGYFSSDRTIEEYNRDIWKLELLDSIELTRYQTEKGFLSFDEYVQMTKDRNRDVTELLKDRGIDLD